MFAILSTPRRRKEIGANSTRAREGRRRSRATRSASTPSRQSAPSPSSNACSRTGPGAAGSPTEHDEPARCNHGETKPDPEPGRADSALVECQGRRGDEQQERDERPVEPETEDVAQTGGLDRRGACRRTADKVTAAMPAVVTRYPIGIRTSRFARPATGTSKTRKAGRPGQCGSPAFTGAARRRESRRSSHSFGAIPPTSRLGILGSSRIAASGSSAPKAPSWASSRMPRAIARQVPSARRPR